LFLLRDGAGHACSHQACADDCNIKLVHFHKVYLINV
jgi:hypothetical protein